jgi:ribosomal protein S18 acetylase RimI-like enzyme
MENAEMERAPSVAFAAVDHGNRRRMRELRKLWVPYWRETTTRNGEKPETGAKIRSRAKNRVAHAHKAPKTGFYALYSEGRMVGFAFFGLSGGIRSLGIPPEYGQVLEFCVAPPFRRRGFATEMNRRMEVIFRGWGIADVFLTPDPVTGEPFWRSAGYRDSQMTDPDNGRPIYVKTIQTNDGKELL